MKCLLPLKYNMLEADRVRITHMFEAAKEAVSFASGKSKTDFDLDRQLQMAVVREIEIIGEASGKVSEATRNEYPQISWTQIANMRNHLVHVYFDIDLDIVWSTLNRNLPLLIQQLEQILGKSK